MSHEMKIMDPRHGHKVVPWDPTDKESVEKAKQEFDTALKEGKRAFRIDRAPRQTGEPIQEFDPKLGEILLVPALSGG